jgi:predicted outer membrane repeat protein
VPYNTFTLTIEGANIVNCKTAGSDYTFHIWYSTGNAALASKSRLGAVASTGNVTIVDSTITNNGVISGVFLGVGQIGSAGGAVASNNDVVIVNSDISDNYVEHNGGHTAANYKAAGGMDGMAGAIYARDDVTITDSTINNNAACRGGAIISNTGWYSGTVFTNADDAAASAADGVIKIVDSTLNENKSSDWGSAIFGQDPLAVTGLNCSVVVLQGNNEVSNNYSAFQYGAIRSAFVYIEGSITAENNITTGETGSAGSRWGEGAFIHAFYLFMDITDDSSISFNKIGGATNGNYATAIKALRQATIEVSSGTLTVEGNGKVASQAYGPIQGTFYFGSTPESQDSAISTSGNGKIVFLDNVLNAGSSGGAILSNNRKLTLTGDITFEGNQATTGGAIYSASGLEIQKNLAGKAPKFINNEAGGNGGAIYAITKGSPLPGASGDVTISDALFDGNSAVNGAAVYAGAIKLEIYGSAFEDNDAVAASGNTYGGAIFMNSAGSSLTIDKAGTTRSTFERNTAKTQGGAIYVGLSVNGAVSISYSDFEENEIGLIGGAIYFGGADGSGAIVDNSTFTENKVSSIAAAVYGGAIGTAVLTRISESTFEGNSAMSTGTYGAYGCAIYAAAALKVSESSFTGNTASNALRGGAIYVTSASALFEVTSSEFSDNEAISGGAIYNLSTGAVITDTEFSYNYASSSGGAIYNGGTLTLNGSVDRNDFTGNVGGSYGGAIFNTATLNVAATDFNGNRAAVGGAIINYSTGTTAVGGSTFTGNEATNVNAGSTTPYNTSGGAIFTSRYANLTINAGVAFSGNIAPVAYSAPIPAAADLDSLGGFDIGTYAANVDPGTTFSGSYSTIYNNADVNYVIAGSAVLMLKVVKETSSLDITTTTQQFDFSYVQVDDEAGAAYSGGTPLTGTISTAGTILIGTSKTVLFVPLSNLPISADYFFKITEIVPATIPAGWTYDANASSGYVVKASIDGAGSITYPGTYNNTTNIPTFTNSFSTPSYTLVLKASKSVASSDITGTSQTFSFRYDRVTSDAGTSLYSPAENGTVSTTGTISVGAPQTVSFGSLTLAPGSYYYKITEIVPATVPAGWTYDANATVGYVVEVTIDVFGNATFGAYDNAANIPTFANSYVASPSQPPITPPIPAILYTITSSSDSGSGINPEGAVSVAEGANATFSFWVDAGYKVASVTVDGDALSQSRAELGSYTFENVRANHSIEIRSVAEDVNPAGAEESDWAALNLILAVLSIAAGAIAVIAGRNRSKDDGERRSKTAWILRAVALAAGIIAVIVFLITEDMSQPVISYDGWTLPMLILFFVSAIFAPLSSAFDKPEEAEKK